MRGTVESVHEHIEMEYSKEAFAVWIFGTENNVVTMVTKPDKFDFAQDTVSAAIASNPVIKELFIEGLENLGHTSWDGDELVFSKPLVLDRKKIIKSFDINFTHIFRIIERGLNTKKMGPDFDGNVLMSTVADYVLPKIQKQTNFTVTESISAVGEILEICGCETLLHQDPENTTINFQNSIFRWRKN